MLVRAADHPFFATRFAAFAHRGGALYGPNLGRENTLHAFTTAVALGYRYLETDVHVTSDSVLVAFHDERLERVTDATGAIAALPYAAVAEARVGGVDPIPRFADLLEAFPHARFSVDLKARAAVEPLFATLRAHDALSRVCVSSFDESTVRAFRRLAGPTVATGAGRRGILWSAKMPVVPRLVSSPGLAFQVPRRHLWLGRDIAVLTRRLVRHAHAAGQVVYVWTVDDEPTIELLIDAGVDGIVSDRIDVLKGVLVRRGLWEGTA